MKIHFISIGGSAMHSLAIALKKNGEEVTGSDDEIFEPSRSRLFESGILPKEEGWFPDRIHSHLDAVILGMHARPNNPELLRAKELGLPVFSYPEYIYQRSIYKKRVVIGGSHGKTTCTSIIMHVLHYCGVNFDYLVGAKLDGFSDSVKITQTAPLIIIEGDEYLSSPIDRRPKFIVYQAHLALLTGIAWDHVNVFETFDIYKQQFIAFLNSLEEESVLVYCAEDSEVINMVNNFIPQRTIQNTEKIPYQIPDFKVVEGKTFLCEPNATQTPINIFGHHNMLNLEGSWIILKELGISRQQFLQAIGSFEGAKKRLELIAENASTKIFLDFAHAPSKIRASIEALVNQFPERKVLAIMELHTFSSLNAEFIEQYRGTMDLAHEAVVYYNPLTLAHKNLPTLGIETVMEAFGRKDLWVMNDSKVLEDYLTNFRLNHYNLIFMSSGNFDGLDIKKLSHSLLLARAKP